MSQPQSYSRIARQHLLCLLRTYLLGIAAFTLFRLLLFVLNRHLLLPASDGWLILRAFWMGFRFDTVISCYLLVLPVFVFGLLFLAGWLRPAVIRAGYLLIGVLFVPAFLLAAIDIPFFHHFFNRLNDTLFNWSAHAAFSFRMVFREPSAYLFLGFFGVVAAAYLKVLRRIRRRHTQVAAQAYLPLVRSRLLFTPAVLLVWGFTFLGIRGRTAAKQPIIPGTAYFSDDPFLNQLGLNPVFTLMRSLLDNRQPENKKLHWMREEEALRRMSALLHADPALADRSPIARRVTPPAPLAGRNVVVVIMESMSAAKMGRYGNPNGLTPFLDSLAAANWAFDRIYSAGIHTYNGIYSTLFAHPALMKKHSMDQLTVPQIAGLPATLRSQGYQTMFFTTHDELFDNISGFLSANGVERIIGQKDYPAREVKSTMGVPDEFLFRYAVPVLNKAAAKNRPFFAGFMTGSDHDPIVIPEGVGFHTDKSDPYQQSVQFADWSIRQFLQRAAATDWYRNTVFVFVADHGCLCGENKYDVAFTYHHIPLIVFAPGATGPQVFEQPGLQTDVFATVMGLVGKPYINNTFSLDLLHERHPYLVFSADTKLACLTDSLMYVYRVNGGQSLYRYRDGNTADYFERDSLTALPMRQTAFAWLQTSQWMLEHGKAK